MKQRRSQRDHDRVGYRKLPPSIYPALVKPAPEPFSWNGSPRGRIRHCDYLYLIARSRSASLSARRVVLCGRAARRTGRSGPRPTWKATAP